MENRRSTADRGIENRAYLCRVDLQNGVGREEPVEAGAWGSTQSVRDSEMSVNVDHNNLPGLPGELGVWAISSDFVPDVTFLELILSPSEANLIRLYYLSR